MSAEPATPLTLVIDIGKSQAKLLLVDGDGQVVERHGRSNASVASPLGYPALDLAGLGAWMQDTLAASAHTRRCGRAMVTTHGAAFVALAAGDELAWAPLDYEWDGCNLPGSALDAAYRRGRDPFEQTLSPDLPMGLNAARQLYWLQHAHPQAWARTRTLLPYPQYWAWWLSGVACTELSSLGCHTQLWRPAAGTWSHLAATQGWASLFAPLRQASEVLGPVRPALAARLGLPGHCQIHVGVHDSNACLARYPGAAELTLVSSGTWTVIMAPGAKIPAQAAQRDMLCNVNVQGQPTPTARFMGGREFAVLLDGARPDAGSVDDVAEIMASQTFALPSFAPQGGPFMDRQGVVVQAGVPLAPGALPEGQRSALAALYCALLTAWLVRQLRPAREPSAGRLVVEGPLAGNRLYMGLLQSLLPGEPCFSSTDELEGTARGAWLLAQDTLRVQGLYLSPAPEQPVAGLAGYQQQWLGMIQA